MRKLPTILVAAAVLCAMTGSYALAAPGGEKGGNSNAPGQIKKGGSAGAPGPIAGAGLPFLLIAGGYALVRRYRSRTAE
jgi:hypothetical protein